MTIELFNTSNISQNWEEGNEALIFNSSLKILDSWMTSTTERNSILMSLNFSDPSGQTTNSSSAVWPSTEDISGQCQQITDKAEFAILIDWKWWLTGLVSSLVGGLGFLGNILAVIVLSRRHMKTAFNQLLITLCVFDTLFLACNVATSIKSLGIKFESISTVIRFSEVGAQISMCISVLMIVALTFERHFAICSPHQYRIHLRTVPRWRHLAMYIAPVTVTSIFFNIPMFINLQRSWMENALYVKINLYLRAFHPLTTTGLAPVAVLIWLNIRICRGIRILHQRRTSRNRRELNMAYIAIVIVSVFVVTNMPRIIAGAYEVTNLDLITDCIEAKVQYVPPANFYKLDFVARFLMVVNSSINFLIYCAISSPFKVAFYDLLRFLPCIPSHWCKKSHSSSTRRKGGSQRRTSSQRRNNHHHHHHRHGSKRRCHGDNELIKAENGENGGDLAIDNNYDMVASGKCKDDATATLFVNGDTAKTSETFLTTQENNKETTPKGQMRPEGLVENADYEDDNSDVTSDLEDEDDSYYSSSDEMATMGKQSTSAQSDLRQDNEVTKSKTNQTKKSRKKKKKPGQTIAAMSVNILQNTVLIFDRQGRNSLSETGEKQEIRQKIIKIQENGDQQSTQV